MGNRSVPLAPDEYFHIYNRGNSKQVIYHEPADYKRFQALMYLANCYERFVFRELDTDDIFSLSRDEQLVRIEAYCLMPNHFHILLTPLVEGGISHFMKKLATGYSMFFNQKYERSGGLYEGRFKSQHADSDEYLRYLYAYIHLNPIKLLQSDWRERGIDDVTQAFTYLDQYPYSSYPDLPIGATYGKRPEAKVIEPVLFAGYFADRQAHQQELLTWLSYGNGRKISP